ncbi:MAG: asparagine synthetase B family protein, partial [Phycisphaerales bacterium]
MLDASIKHRGPDGQGRWRARFRKDQLVVDVAFVHRRLSIIDLPNGAQPMVQGGETLLFEAGPDVQAPSGPNDYVTKATHHCPACRAKGEGLTSVLFNGCLYNHRQLRVELEDAGHVFESDHADTEVLLHGWREWGDAFLSKLHDEPVKSPASLTDRLEGMYACAIWSPESLRDLFSSRPFMAVDPAGEKPLYTADVDVGLSIFCSTAAGLEQLLARIHKAPRNHSQRRLRHWVRFGHGEELLHPVRPLDRPSRGRNETAADLWFAGYPKDDEIVRDDPAQVVEQTLRRAVHDRLESDRPLGCFLSGGVDSSLVAAFARAHSPDLLTFTVRMPDPRYDESEHAERAAAHLGTKHQTLEVEPNPAEDLCRLIEELGLPFGDSSLLPAFWVSRAARALVPVALGGDGGDELFAGYERYNAANLLSRHRGLLRALPASLMPDAHPKSIFSKAGRLARAARGLHMFDLGVIFSSHDLDQLCGPRPMRPWTWEISARQLRRIDLTNYLPDDLLRKADTASMAVGLELRAPFLDRRLIHLACRCLTIDQIMPGGERKGLLKQVARKHLPT